MAFCQNCGKELAYGAKFCDGCGTAVGASVADGSKRTIKFMAGGEIIKCPQCGEQGFSKFAKVCPSCGYKFEAQVKSAYVEEIQEKLDECDGSLEEELRIVRNIICPNDAQAMYEMLIIASERISSVRDDSLNAESYSKLLKKAWFGIISSIEKKSSLMFGDTEEGRSLNSTAKSIKKAARKEVLKMSSQAKAIIGFLIIGILLVVGIIYGAGKAYKYISAYHKVADEKLVNLETEITKCIEENDLDQAEYLFIKIKNESGIIHFFHISEIIDKERYFEKKINDARKK